MSANPDLNLLRWIQHIRESHENTAPGQRFSLNDHIVRQYGALDSKSLNRERDRIEYVLKFANGDEQRVGAEEFLARERDLRDVPAAAGRLSANGEASLAGMRGDLSEDSLKRLRESLKRFLNLVIEDRSTAIRQFNAGEHGAIQTVIAQPTVRSSRADVEIEYHHIINSTDAFQAFIAILMLSKKHDIGRYLCKCRVSDCKRFFLSEKRRKHGGKPIRVSCSPEHRKLVKDNQTSKRKRKQRAVAKVHAVLKSRQIGSRTIGNHARDAYDDHPDATLDELVSHTMAAIRAARRPQ